MELTGTKPCVISVGVGGHYEVGVNRLERSLIYQGYAGDMRFWKNEYPTGCPEHGGDGQYNFKPFAFREQFSNGYKIVIWCDASLWAVNNITPLLDYVNEHGLYFFKSGYSLAETATDKLLSVAGVYREELYDVPEFATGLVGVNIENPKGKEFFTKWEDYRAAGLFGGNRIHDLNDSQHPKFRFSRQDQSAASMILYKMGITTCGEDRNFQAYKDTGHDPKNVLFFIGGL